MAYSSAKIGIEKFDAVPLCNNGCGIFLGVHELTIVLHNEVNIILFKVLDQFGNGGSLEDFFLKAVDYDFDLSITHVYNRSCFFQRAKHYYIMNPDG